MSQIDFDVLYKNHAQEVYNFLLRLCGDANLAEDILQDTFLKAMEKVDKFDNRCKVTSWLCQIAKNTYFDYLRKKQKYNYTSLQEYNSHMKSPSPEEKLLDSEEAKEIRKMVHQLPEPYKEVFLLRVYAELPFKEIGHIFGKTEVWGRVTYMRSKDMIIRMMTNGRKTNY